MSVRMDENSCVKDQETDKMRMKQVRFCIGCKGDQCEKCAILSSRKQELETHVESVTFHQIKTDITCYVSENSREMIADIGCPNSVIGIKDVSNFKRGLSKFQLENLEVVDVDEKFKFGPSGPYRCSKKMRFPIKNRVFVEVAIVDANIPMLLGNNVMKPLSAEIKLFSSGDGIMKLKDTEIKLKETYGGHYTLKIRDLAKLCETSTFFLSKCFNCDQCGNSFPSTESLRDHKDEKHERKKCEAKECDKCAKTFFDRDCFKHHMRDQTCEMPVKIKSGLKNTIKAVEYENNYEKIITELNTLLNGSGTKTEKRMMLAMKNLTQLQQGQTCDKCGKEFANSANLERHMSCVNDDNAKLKCDYCDDEFGKNADLQNHVCAIHEDTRKFNNIFHSHHEEDDELDLIELDTNLWEILLSEKDENNTNELTDAEEKEILKLHRYFAHRSGDKLWENLLQPAGRMKGKKKLLLKFLEQCEICKTRRRTPQRQKVGLPKSKDVNDVVSMDIKILKKTGKTEIGILYIHDEFSKMIKGQVINDKKKETIIKAIENKWIIGDGSGPGHPSRGFFADNGGEFLNDDLIDFAAALNISIKFTAASSPWMNGSCERNHATVDRIVDKIMADDPNMNLQKAVNLACFVKNTEINKTGFSPLQLFCGRSPSFPGLSDCSPGSIELEGNNEYLKVLRRLDEARIQARNVDCNQRIKVAMKSQINSSCEKNYTYGNPIWFKMDTSQKWKSATVLGQDGKILFIKYGNFIRRVPVDRVIPADAYIDSAHEEIEKEDVENRERLEDDEFRNVEIVALKDKEIEELKKSKEITRNKMKELEDKLSTLEEQLSSQQANISSTTPQTNVKEILLPNLYQKITFQEVGEIEKTLKGKVIQKQKKSSKFKNTVGIKLENGKEKDFDFSKDIKEWKDEKDCEDKNYYTTDPCCLHTFLEEKDFDHEVFATVLTKAEVKGRPDLDQAISDEISKFENFGAFRRVTDEGQYAIKTRWVFSEHDESKGYKLKARLCMRGDREENRDIIRADSPTANKDSLKLALAIAANENFEIISGDIKSAFLQGKSLDRKVFVIPPVEANEKGVLWLLEKGAYGLMDGSRLFYLELKEKLESLGMRAVSGDSALFTKHKDGKLIGLVCVHVDDLFMAGNSDFKRAIIEKLLTHFQFSKVETNKFTYLGCEIEKLANGDITLNQNEYIQKVGEVSVPPKSNSTRVNEEERKLIRKVVGEMLWVSLMTRPDLAFEVNRLSSVIVNATIKDLKDAKRLVDKAKMEPITLNFTKLGPKETLKIRIYCDASFNNQEQKLRSTEGRVILLENEKSDKSNVFSWKTKKISRICRSVKGAETRAMENGLDEAIHFARMVKEIYDGEVNLKHPKQIKVEAVTDNKSLWENLNNTRQCDEKLLRNSVALIKEMVDKSEVKDIKWVETSSMLADILTKTGGNSSWIKKVVSKNTV